jgi:hypothetical protein
MNKPVDDVLGRDAAVLRVRGALAFTDASRPGAAAIADAAILVRDGKIASVGVAADPVTADPRALEIGGDRYWIIPGLVNAHSHGRGLGWFRLGAPDDALEPWICQILTQPGLDPYLDTVLSEPAADRGGRHHRAAQSLPAQSRRRRRDRGDTARLHRYKIARRVCGEPVYPQFLFL